MTSRDARTRAGAFDCCGSSFYFLVCSSTINGDIRSFDKFQTISSRPRQCRHNITPYHVHAIVRTLLLLLLLFAPRDVSRALILLKSPRPAKRALLGPLRTTVSIRLIESIISSTLAPFRRHVQMNCAVNNPSRKRHAHIRLFIDTITRAT